MIEKYKDNYEAYLLDQVVKFQSFEGELYYDQIASEIGYIFLNYIIRLANPPKVLDMCCGDGTTTEHLYNTGFCDIKGFDANHNKIVLAKQKYPSIEFWVMDAKNTEILEGGYDIIFASHCFEHFLDPIPILIQTACKLADNGIIILILPYPNEECEGHPGSTKLWLDKDIDTVKNNFEGLGFEVLRIETMNFREPELLIVLK